MHLRLRLILPQIQCPASDVGWSRGKTSVTESGSDLGSRPRVRVRVRSRLKNSEAEQQLSSCLYSREKACEVSWKRNEGEKERNRGEWKNKRRLGDRHSINCTPWHPSSLNDCFLTHTLSLFHALTLTTRGFRSGNGEAPSPLTIYYLSPSPSPSHRHLSSLEQRECRAPTHKATGMATSLLGTR